VIPFGPIGRASADHIANPQRLRPPGSGQRDARGVISFLAIPIVVFWIMTQAWQHALGSIACWAVFLAATAALWWAAFLTSGLIGLLSGAGFALLAAYSISNGILANSGLVLQISVGVIAFIFVGGDQIAVKQERAMRIRDQS
jgi:hypothetical protein